MDGIRVQAVSGLILVLACAALPGCTGSLVVTLAPEAAVSAGAQWRVDGGTWQPSGATVAGLSAGEHAITYDTVPGWTAPAGENVSITAGQASAVTGTYTQGGGEGEGEGEKPGLVQGVTATPGADRVLLRWQAGADPYLTGYRVYRAGKESGPFANLTSSPIPDTRYEDSAVTSGTDYWFKVAAVNAVGEGPRSAAVRVTAGGTRLGLAVMKIPPNGFARIPISIGNANGISPGGMRIEFQYDPEVLDRDSLQVERTAITRYAPVVTDAATPGLLAITTTDATGQLVGEGKLFDVFARPNSQALNGAACDISFGTVVLKDTEGNPVLVDAGDKGQIVIAGGEIRGDLDGNGTVDDADAKAALEIAVGGQTAGEASFQIGDLNGDGVIDSADATMVMRMGRGDFVNPTGPDAAALDTVLAQTTEVTISVGEVEAAPGATVDVPVDISDARGLSGLVLTLTYPTEFGVIFDGATAGGLAASFLEPVAHHEAGVIRVGLSAASALGGAQPLPGNIVLLRFRVPAGAAAGTRVPVMLADATLTGQYADRFDWYVTVLKKGGRISVGAGGGEGEGEAQRPAAAFTASPGEGLAPLTVQFTDQSQPGSQPIGSRQWDFGDGGSSAGTSPSHTFQQPGVYTVTLTVISPTGNGVAARNISVGAPPSAGFTSDVRAGQLPLTVRFTIPRRRGRRRSPAGPGHSATAARVISRTQPTNTRRRASMPYR